MSSCGITYYMHLVAAHCHMSFKAWGAALRCLRKPTRLKEDDDLSQSDSDKEDGHKKDDDEEEDSEPRTKLVNVDGQIFRWEEKDPPGEVVLEVWARKYLEEVKNIDGGLMKYFDALPREVSEFPNRFRRHRSYQDAWLVMMLRGITWSNSTTLLRDASGGEANLYLLHAGIIQDLSG